MEYDVRPQVQDPITGQFRPSTHEEIINNVRYWLSKDSSGHDTLEIPFIFQDPSNKVRVEYSHCTQHPLTMFQDSPFSRNYLFEVAERFLFQSRGYLAKVYTGEFNNQYSLVLLALICAAVCAVPQFSPCSTIVL